MRTAGYPRERQHLKTSWAALFDLDGTLVESAPDLMSALNVALTEAGREPIALAQVREMIGDGLPTLVERGFEQSGGMPSSSILANAVKRCHDYYAQHVCVHSHLFEGVAEALEALRGQGYALGVCTNKPQAAANGLLQALGIAGHFSCVIGGDSLPYKKPDPRPLLHALEEMAATPRRAIMIGDSRNDVLCARNAKLPVVLATFGYNTLAHDELAADAVFSAFSELPEILHALTAR